MWKKVKTSRDVRQSEDLQTRSTTTSEIMNEQIPLRTSRNIRRGHIISAMRDINHMQWRRWERSVAGTLHMMEKQRLDGANRNYNALDRVQHLLKAHIRSEGNI